MGTESREGVGSRGESCHYKKDIWFLCKRSEGIERSGHLGVRSPSGKSRRNKILRNPKQQGSQSGWP